jgi:hypothetical protein
MIVMLGQDKHTGHSTVVVDIEPLLGGGLLG